jgi:hypothetical protein
LKKNISESIARNTIENLKPLKKSNSVNEFTFKYLYPAYYRTPEIYALIKIHKKDNPCRIICPYFEHPCAKLTKHLNHILSQIIRCDENSIRDSNEFAKFIQNFEISEDEIMASIEFTLKLIEKRIKNYTNLNDITDLNTVGIVSLLEFCMKNNIISFNNKFYLQMFGAPMGAVYHLL